MRQMPVGWTNAALRELADFIMGQAPPGADCNKSGRGTPFVKAGEFGPKRPVIREWTMRPLRLAQEADVLICVVGATSGKINLGADCAIGRSVAAIRPLDALSQRYLYSFLSTKVLELRSGSVGTAQGVISKDDLANIEIALAPLPEQRRMVAKIDSLSAKSKRASDHLDHISRLVDKYKQAILAAAFRGEMTADWRNQQPALKTVHARTEVKARRGGSSTAVFDPPYPVPSSWQWLRLPDIGDLDRGKSRHRPRNDPRLFGGPYPFIQTGDVRSADRFLTSYNDTYSEFGLSQSRLWPVGTLCITIAANIAETALLTFESCFPDSVVGFLPNVDRVDASYVEFFLRTARAELEAFAPATAQKNINLETLSNIRLPVPAITEQKEIVDRIETTFAWIDRVASEGTSARKLIDRLDQAVLAKAFRGELVPQDANDEPATVLLERIRAERVATATLARRGSARTVNRRSHVD
jgi:type I restriction enzyme, S subunit